MCSKLANRLEYFWHVYGTPCLIAIAAVCFFWLSIIVVLFQVSLYLSWEASGVYKAWSTYSEDNKSTSFFVANLLCVIPLSYICASSYIGLFKIKVHSFYALHPKQQTDPPCLVYSGLLLMRLANAVAYNFLELSRV